MLKMYVLKTFLRSYFLTVMGLIGIFLIVDFFERADEFLSRGAPTIDILAYYFYKIPFVFFFMGPQAVLLATVIALATMARHNEFTAMKSCGIGVTGITLPIVGAALGIALLVVASNGYIAPITSKKMNHIFLSKVRKSDTYNKILNEKIWLTAKDNTIWNINHYDPEQKLMTGVSLLQTDPDLFIRQRIDADWVVWDGKQWEFQDGYFRTFNEKGLESTEFFEKMIFPVQEKPKDFLKRETRKEEMSIRDLYREIQKQSNEGKDTDPKWVELHQKISYPFISIVMALLAIPLSLRSSRRGGVLFCIAVNLGMGFAFSFIYAMGISLGLGGTFSPALAAWGPTLLFILLGFYLILTMDSERLLPI
jgi:lipopolysaccharide export system permease protein